MVVEESTQCARCGEGPVSDSIRLPPTWETYLREERGLEWTPRLLAIPCCEGCTAVIEGLTSEYWFVPKMRATAEASDELVLDELDRLDIDAIHHATVVA